MHFKKSYYIKGIHIKLIFKNNLLRCFIYNYSGNRKYVACELDSILVKDKKPLVNDRLFLLRKRPFILSQEITYDKLKKHNYFLAFELFDELKNPIIHDVANKPFTQTIQVFVT